MVLNCCRFKKITVALTTALVLLLCVATQVRAMPKVERVQLPNGLVLLILEDHSIPVVTLGLLANAGSWKDPPEFPGMANLAAEALMLGTTSHDAGAINESLDFMGATLEADCTRDFAILKLKCLRKDLDSALPLLVEVVTTPTFPEKETKAEADREIGAIKVAENDPESVAIKAFDQALFSYPYGHPVKGTAESLQKITRQAVADFHGAWYRPGNCILTVVGDITAEEVRSRVAGLLEKWTPGQSPSTAFPDPFTGRAETVLIEKKVNQASVILGHMGVPRANKDYAALQVMNQVLGLGALTSRLADEIRIKRGLAYSVVSLMMPMKHAGSFSVILQTKNASAREAIDLAKTEIERIRREPVSAEELDLAKGYLVGSFPQKFETQDKLASYLPQLEFFGLGLDYPERYPGLISAVTREDVLRVAREYLHPDNLTTVVVGDLKEAGFNAGGQ